MADLLQLAARLRSLGPAVVDDVIPELVIAVREELRNSIAAGTDADGNPWAMRKDGGRALRNALDAIHVGANGRLIVVRLTGVEVMHHRGYSRGGVTRPVIPTGALPRAWARAFERVIDRRFVEAANG